MDRYAIHNLFGIKGFTIAWYGIIIAMGMVLGVLLASYRAKKNGYRPDLIWDLAIWAIPFAIVGARLYYVIFQWREYVTDPIKIFATREGGLAIYGGVIAGILVVLLFCRYQKFPILKLLDLTIPSLVLGQVIGRWGNFMNQEAFGNLIQNPKLQFFPYGVYIAERGEWHQATFFYESMWNLLLFAILLFLAGKVKKDGYLPAVYFIGYGIGRFLIEGLRTDSLYLFANIRVSQLLSALLVAFGVVLVILIQKNKLVSRIYDGKYLIKEGSEQP